MPGYGSRFWAERTADNRRRAYPKFRGDATADVVIIGGGLTGCAAAFALASAGLDVVLLEAARLAGGSTAGAIGAIVPQPDAQFVDVERASGARSARIGWKEAKRGALELATALRKLPTKCDLEPAPLFINAMTGADAVGLRKEQAARRKAGVDAPWLAAPAARRALALDTAGAIRLAEGFQYDPVRATLGLAGAAEAKGARIFEGATVRRTKFTRKDATVVLGNGSIRTRGVFVATGEPGTVFGQLRRHVRESEGYVVVTHPLTAAMRKEIGKRGGILTEASANAHWLRWLPDDRILFAGALGKPTKDRQRDKVLVQRTAQLMYELSVRYPAMSGLPAAWSWTTPVISTLDGLPWIGPHRNYPHHFFALATGWTGDALAWFAAKSAVRFFRGNATKEDEVMGFARYL
jgi:glycine/D-amino acid oxidase-like deaminating enzyme